MTVQFKLSKQNGLTRRITFATRPAWPILSDKIAALYDIAIQNVAVSYIDSDGDEVTLSSNEELQDFYTSLSALDDGTIKLAIRDLSSTRSTVPTSQPLPSAAPQQSHFRNTFGGHEVLPLVFDTDDEWQRLPGGLGSLFLSRDAPESPHAFVEVLESDVSVTKSDAAGSEGGNPSRSDHTFTPTFPQTKDKGKGRAATVDDDVSSAGSVIANEVPAKPPVHVFDVSCEDIFGLSPRSTVNLPRSGAATPAQAQSTPVITEQPLKADVTIPATPKEEKTDVLDDDPPLPSLNLHDPDCAFPSLVHDIAALLTSISTVISTHPELSGHLRNIVVNATNGTYWTAHRGAISRAAEDLQRTALQETGRSLEDLRRTTEQEASARVTEAIGKIFRTVGEFAQVAQENTAHASGNTTRVAADGPTSNIPRSPVGVVPTPAFPCLPPHPHRMRHSWFGPPPFGHMGGPYHSGLAHPPHPPPPPPPPPPPCIPGWPRPPPPLFWGSDAREKARAAAAERLASAAGVRARFTQCTQDLAEANAPQPTSTSDTTPEQLRADVERAKEDYKVRRERYRHAKTIRKMAELRRREQESGTESISRQTSDNPTQTTPEKEEPIPIPPTPAAEHQSVESITAASDVHIVSNARGPYPQLEMFSVPRRSHTIGHMHRGHAHEGRENRPFNRIMRKLSDMGFTEGTYPNLNGKVMDQLLSHPPVTKDAEDDIVTNLIEELVSNGVVTHPGGSAGIPGAWR